jgi:hypothetical protein
MHRVPIIHAIRPLRRLIWGALLVLLDFILFKYTNDGVGFRIDVLDDTVGMVLIASAVATLRDIYVSPSYAVGMGFVRWVAILALLESILDHFIFPQPAWLELSVQALGYAKPVAILLFCACMRELCREAMLPEAGRKWLTTLMLFLVVYGIPLALSQLAAILPNAAIHIDAGPWMMWVVLIFLVPLISFFSATSTMARLAESAPSPRAATTSWPYVAAPPAE